MALGFITKDIRVVVPILILWEVVEQLVLAKIDEWWKEPIGNSITDVVIGSVGAVIGIGITITPSSFL